MMPTRTVSHDNSNKCPSLFEAGTELRVLYVLTNLNLTTTPRGRYYYYPFSTAGVPNPWAADGYQSVAR